MAVRETEPLRSHSFFVACVVQLTPSAAAARKTAEKRVEEESLVGRVKAMWCVTGFRFRRGPTCTLRVTVRV
jgi:hypothetical protein